MGALQIGRPHQVIDGFFPALFNRKSQAVKHRHQADGVGESGLGGLFDQLDAFLLVVFHEVAQQMPHAHFVLGDKKLGFGRFPHPVQRFGILALHLLLLGNRVLGGGVSGLSLFFNLLLGQVGVEIKIFVHL